MNKKIVFLTGTRADFGKLKSLMKITQDSNAFDVHIFVTGMHMNSKYGKTVDEVFKSGFENIYQFINHDTIEHMDRTLAKTVDGFSHYIAELEPDLIIVHGDRVEALAGAIVGSLNNILVAHVEGGEISGTIDELIRHSVSKLSHIHLVANPEAKRRLIQMGEYEKSIHIIGSPDLDLMNPRKLPKMPTVQKYYEIDFDEFAILMFHPVTTEYKQMRKYTKNLVNAVIESNLNFVVIYPNNDLGSNEILHEMEVLKDNDKFRVFPSLRFEYFLALLNNSRFMIGNSSAALREAPYYKIPSINIGTRQSNRVKDNKNIINCDYKKESILEAIEQMKDKKFVGSSKTEFGDGTSDEQFIELLKNKEFWKIKQQKQFLEIF
ncbi:UDP-N-acetylglucosamine 2-epimerase [Arcobacter peruensis]|uniref:UDP-N-acetylglucosamine 2-epimerase n=1 Tax=Arcobacter peruensis TaxID=2320140 RepID=UPI000F08740F|nr:UDP-N-acetylglucosamine 2-epimerase [Arcobacter peruensis]